MPFYYQFQRVRIVNATWSDGTSYPQMVGQECTLMRGTTCNERKGGPFDAPSWETDLQHPTRGGARYCVLESMIEPIQYDFDKEEEENILEELDLELTPELIVVRGDTHFPLKERHF